MLLQLDLGPDGPLHRMLAQMSIRKIKIVGRSCKQLRSSVRALLRNIYANRIREFWKENSSQTLALEYLSLNLTPAAKRDFTQVVEYLQEDSVICTANRFMRRLLRWTTDRKQHLIKVFLAAVMIAYYPRNVFESVGDAERAVHDAAGALLECVQTIATVLSVSKYSCFVSPEYLQKLPGLYATYERDFKNWRTPDLAKLLDRINKSFNSLVWAFLEFPLDPQNENVHAEIRVQLRVLIAKLVQIKGPNALQTFEALRASLIPWETLDEHDPVDWELWANYVMNVGFDIDWEGVATRYMADLLA